MTGTALFFVENQCILQGYVVVYRHSEISEQQILKILEEKHERKKYIYRIKNKESVYRVSSEFYPGKKERLPGQKD